MPLERQVNLLAGSRKITLFLVEGITDEISLALTLSRIIEKQRIVKFKLIRGDISSRDNTNPVNIQNKITDEIKGFINSDIYKKSDILQIVHLVDMDGAYIPDEQIMWHDKEHYLYTAENIFAKDTEYAKRRNKMKSQVLNKLAGLHTVYADLPYSIYFFSCNLEHVLHNQQNADDKDKTRLAHEAEDLFTANPQTFIAFMNDSSIAVEGDYDNTWRFIKQSANSLHRNSNFHLFLNNIVSSPEVNS